MRNQHTTIPLRVNSAQLSRPASHLPPSHPYLLRGPRLPACRGGPRTEPPPAWEARRHALEAVFWAAHLQEFEECLARLRRNRGDARATRLVRDVLAKVEDTQGTGAALLERERLLARWREQGAP